MADLAKMWECRASITRPDAQKALAAASKARSLRDQKAAAAALSNPE
jgi:hypothetical protein